MLVFLNMGRIRAQFRAKKRFLVASTLLLFLFQFFDPSLRAAVNPEGEGGDPGNHHALISSALDQGEGDVERHRETGMDFHDCPICLVKSKLFIGLETGIEFLAIRLLPIPHRPAVKRYDRSCPPVYPDFQSRAPPA